MFTSKDSTSGVVTVVTRAVEAAWAQAARFLSMVFSRSKTAPLRITERWAVTVPAPNGQKTQEEAEDCREVAVTDVQPVAVAVAALSGPGQRRGRRLRRRGRRSR